MKELSVNEAIRIGERKSEIRFMIAFYACFLPCGLAIVFLELPFYFLFIGIAVGLILSFYFSTTYLYTWQIWAYERVRNTNELRQKAEKHGLIPTWETKLFPPSYRHQIVLQGLAEKLSQPDEVYDKPEHLQEFDIYYAKGINVFQLIAWSIGFIISILILLSLYMTESREDNLWSYGMAIFLHLVCVYCVIENIFQLRMKAPVITFSEEGIRIKKTFLKKEEIRDIEIKPPFLDVRFHRTKIPFPVEIKDLDITKNQLEDIAAIFVRQWNTPVH